jgi:hypothetical protein
MHRLLTIGLTTMAFAVRAAAQSVCVFQDNTNLVEDTHWRYVPAPNEIHILQSSTYIFQFRIEDCSGNPATIDGIVSYLDESQPEQTIRIQIGSAGSPGALEVKRISIEPSDPQYADNVTTEIVGLQAAGDLLETAAMTVDQVTGAIQVGGALRRAMEVGSTVAQPISIRDGEVGDGLAAEVTAEFQGSEAAFSQQQTPNDVSVAPLRTPFSQKGPGEEEEELGLDRPPHQMPFIEQAAGTPRNQ